MRKLLLSLGLVALLGGPAAAEERYQTEERVPRETSHRIRLDRSMFDQVGPRVDVMELCGPAGARSVENRRTGSDALLGVLSVGFYTPTHVNVECNVER